MIKNAKNVTELTDLCIAINAVEGTECAAAYRKQNERVRKTLYQYMIGTAERLYILGVSIKRLNRAIKDAGWEDQHFAVTPASEGTYLKIVED